jgi:hypothetical protein
MNKIDSLYPFSNNRYSNPEVESFDVNDLRFDCDDGVVVGRAHLITRQDIDDSNQNGIAVLDVEFDVRFIVVDSNIEAVTIDEPCNFEFVGECESMIADVNSDWDLEVINLNPFDVALNYVMCESDKDKIIAMILQQ